MGNRVYVTLNGTNTYYLHWQGGLDSWIPMFRAVQICDFEVIPSDIVAAMDKVFNQKMELQTDTSCLRWNEENGHYFIDLRSLTFKYRMVTFNKRTEMDDITSDIVTDCNEDIETYIKTRFKTEYHEQGLAEYPERVKAFNAAIIEAATPRLTEKRKQKEENAKNSKKNFKTLFKIDIQKDMPSLWPKVESIRYRSFSGGDAVDVRVFDTITEDEAKYLKELCYQYEYGSFNGMDDCYEYKTGDCSKARTAKYVHYQTVTKKEVSNE
jgi:hypothetical protein